MADRVAQAGGTFLARWWLPVAAVAVAALVLYLCTGSPLFFAAPLLVGFCLLLGFNGKLAYGLLLLTIPLAQPVHLGGGLSTTLPDEPLTWVFCLALPLLLYQKGRKLSLDLLTHPISVLLGLQLLWLVVATITSTDHLLSLKYTLARGWMLTVFFGMPWLLLDGRADFRRAGWLLLAPVVASLFLVIPRHAALDFGFLQINDAVQGLYYNHVEYSTLLSMLLPLAAVARPSRRGPRKRWQVWLWSALMLLLLTALLLAYARAAILAVLFAAIAGGAICYRLAGVIMPACYAVIVAVAAWLIADDRYLNFRPDYAHTYMHDDLNGHLTATFNGTDMSGMERVYRWVAAARMSRERPLTGFGPNTFVLRYKPYTVTGFKTYVSRNEEGSTTHNYFLYLLTEQGWPATLLYGALYWVLFLRAQRTYHRLTDPFYRRCVLGLAMLLAAAFVNNFFSELFDTHKIGAVYYLALSGLVWLDRCATAPVRLSPAAGVSSTAS